ADVSFSLQRFMNEKAQSPGGSVLKTIVDHIEEADPYTVKLYTKEISMNLSHLLSAHQQETGIAFCKRYLTEKAGDDFEAQTTSEREAYWKRTLPVRFAPARQLLHL